MSNKIKIESLILYKNIHLPKPRKKSLFKTQTIKKLDEALSILSLFKVEATKHFEAIDDNFCLKTLEFTDCVMNTYSSLHDTTNYINFYNTEMTYEKIDIHYTHFIGYSDEKGDDLITQMNKDIPIDMWDADITIFRDDLCVGFGKNISYT